MKQPEGTWELITPKKAEQYLKLNTNNRALRSGVAEKYAADMRDGQWLENPQPIMFYEDGSLADGQHRLWAVIESDVPTRFYVIRGASKKIALNIDTGLGRGLLDNAKIAGGAEHMNHTSIGASSFIHYGTHYGKPLSNAQRLELVRKYQEPISWALAHMSKKRYVSTAVVMAAVGRAYMHEKDLERLAEFCDILGSGMPKGPEDQAAVAIRNYILEIGSRIARDRRDVFLKTMNAIKYFMRRKPLTVIKGQKEEAYPLKRMK